MTLAKRRCTWTVLLIAMAMMTPWVSAQHPDRWPRFRGEGAKGLNADQALPVQWDGESMANIAWKIRVPGLGLSSPVVWDGKVFLTSAVSHVEEPFLQVGLFGESPENPEDYEHQYTVYCYDAKTGKTLWEKVAITAVPRQQRHIKASHANCTLAIDGKHVLAFFDSQGMYCFDMDGQLLWKKDMGLLDAGPFDATDLTWGFASSPILYDDKVYLQCDTRNQKFIAAYNADTGEQVWKTPRTDVPSWGSPVIVQVDGRPQVVVNGWHRRAAYDALTGKEIWWMDGGGDVPTPTPFEAHDHLYFSSAHGRQRPLYVIKKSAVGDISLKGRATSNKYVTWANLRRGAYQSTPLVLDDMLYVIQGNGVLTTYNALTGEQIYRELAGGERSAYSASPVAADGRIYFNSEFGKIHVVEAGAEYKHLATNVMGDEIMATPAIAGKSMFVRTRRFLWAVRNQGDVVTTQTVQPAAPTPTKPKFTPPSGEITDARQILETAALACYAVNDITFDIEVIGTGTLSTRIPHVKMTFEASAQGQIRVKGDILMAEGQPAIPFHLGYDNKHYYIIDHANKRIHREFSAGILGRYAAVVGAGNLRKFGREASFAPELTAPLIEIQGTEIINGVDCYKIFCDYQSEGSRPDIWFIGKSDFLPHKYIEVHTQPGGPRSELIKILTRINTKPNFTANAFELPHLQGYEVTDKTIQ